MGDIGPLVGEEVGVDAPGEFGGDAQPTVALVEIAVGGDVLVVGHVGAVVGAAGVTRTGGTGTALDPEARGQVLDVARQLGVGVAVTEVDGEAVSSPTDDGGVLLRVRRPSGVHLVVVVVPVVG